MSTSKVCTAAMGDGHEIAGIFPRLRRPDAGAVARRCVLWLLLASHWPAAIADPRMSDNMMNAGQALRTIPASQFGVISNAVEGGADAGACAGGAFAMLQADKRLARGQWLDRDTVVANSGRSLMIVMCMGSPGAAMAYTVVASKDGQEAVRLLRLTQSISRMTPDKSGSRSFDRTGGRSAELTVSARFSPEVRRPFAPDQCVAQALQALRQGGLQGVSASQRIITGIAERGIVAVVCAPVENQTLLRIVTVAGSAPEAARMLDRLRGLTGG